MSHFTDHFAPVAANYAQFRPTYPAELFTWLVPICPAQDVAWDCATGSGQAALALTAHFAKVIATDASSAQLVTATAHPRIEYRVALAEDSGLPSSSVDLITVAQALHWFDLNRFYAEARRVLKPGGILAVWTYGMFNIEGNDSVNTLVQNFYHHTVGSYWPPERLQVENGYRDLAFPFTAISAPPFEIKTHWTLAQLSGYLRSWSATGRYREDRGIDPVIQLENQLLSLWDNNIKRQIIWPLALRVGN